LKRSCRCVVFSSKDQVPLDVASATSMGRPEGVVVAVERASRSSGTPGSGLQEGKSSEQSSERRLQNSSWEIFNWAHSKNMFVA